MERYLKQELDIKQGLGSTESCTCIPIKGDVCNSVSEYFVERDITMVIYKVQNYI